MLNRAARTKVVPLRSVKLLTLPPRGPPPVQQTTRPSIVETSGDPKFSTSVPSSFKALPSKPVNVDAYCEDKDNYRVLFAEDYLSVLLIRRWTGNSVSFVLLQAVEALDGGAFALYARSNRIEGFHETELPFDGDLAGDTKFMRCATLEEAKNAFYSVFEFATGNKWKGTFLETLFVYEFVLGKYVLLSRTSSSKFIPSNYPASDLPLRQTSDICKPEEPLKKCTTERKVDTDPQLTTEASRDDGNTKPSAMDAEVKSETVKGSVDLEESHAVKESVDLEESHAVKESVDLEESHAVKESVKESVDLEESDILPPPEADFMVERTGLEVLVDENAVWCAALSGNLDSKESFFILQVLQNCQKADSNEIDSKRDYFFYSRGGEKGCIGRNCLLTCDSIDKAKLEFETKFFDFTGNTWKGSLVRTTRMFEPVDEKLTVLERSSWKEFFAEVKPQNTIIISPPQTPSNSERPMKLILPSPKFAEELCSSANPSEKPGYMSPRHAVGIPPRQACKRKGSKADHALLTRAKTDEEALLENQKMMTRQKTEDSVMSGRNDETRSIVINHEVATELEKNETYDVILSAKLTQPKEKGKFYIVKVIQRRDRTDDKSTLFINTGRLGNKGTPVTKSYNSLKQGKRAFEQQFLKKTKNIWLGDLESTKAQFTAADDDTDAFVLDISPI